MSHPRSNKKPLTLSESGVKKLSGAKEVRTPGLIIANDALYQLSYSPVECGGRKIEKAGEKIKANLPPLHEFHVLDPLFGSEPDYSLYSAQELLVSHTRM